MDEQEVGNVVFSPEFISALGVILTLVFGWFAKIVRNQMTDMNKRTVKLEHTVNEQSDEIKAKDKALMDNQSLIAHIQSMYSQSLQQITDLNAGARQSNSEIAKLQNQLSDVNAIILDQQDKIKKYVEEIQRLQPFEKLAHERNGEIKKLTAQIDELEHKFDIEIAKRQGALEALTALDVVTKEPEPEKVKPNEQPEKQRGG